VSPVITPPALADQPASAPWVTSSGGVGNQALSIGVASTYYDPTVETVTPTFNEFGFLTSRLPAPVNPATNAVPLTNADICAWMGHVVPSPCSRCGVAFTSVSPVQPVGP
jgi:hypothetical protein